MPSDILQVTLEPAHCVVATRKRCGGKRRYYQPPRPHRITSLFFKLSNSMENGGFQNRLLTAGSGSIYLRSAAGAARFATRWGQ
jgi:hypothetical protein